MLLAFDALLIDLAAAEGVCLARFHQPSGKSANLTGQVKQLLQLAVNH
jgi:hypothetical protein